MFKFANPEYLYLFIGSCAGGITCVLQHTAPKKAGGIWR